MYYQMSRFYSFRPTLECFVAEGFEEMTSFKPTYDYYSAC